MSFMCCLPEDLQRAVLQTWVLPQGFNSNDLLELWSTLDVACTNHGLRAHLMSAYVWQTSDDVATNGHALEVKDLGGFCHWMSRRGLDSSSSASKHFTLPCVDGLAHSSSLDACCLAALSSLCPNMTAVTTNTGLLADEVLEGIRALGWEIRWNERTEDEIDDVANTLQRIGCQLQELRLMTELDDMDLVHVFLGCSHLRTLEFAMPEREIDSEYEGYNDNEAKLCPDPPSRIALVICLLLSTHCEELIVHNLGQDVDDAISIAQLCPQLRRLSFPDWECYTFMIVEFLTMTLDDCPSLDFLQLNTSSYDRVKGTLTLDEDQRGNYLCSDALGDLLKSCVDSIHHLTTRCTDIKPAVVDIVAPHLISLSLAEIDDYYHHVDRSEGYSLCAFIEHCAHLEELLVDWELEAEDFFAVGRYCSKLRLLSFKAIKPVEGAHDAFVNMCNSLPLLAEVVIDCAPDYKELLAALLQRRFRVDKFILGSVTEAAVHDVNQFHIAARNKGLLPVPVVEMRPSVLY